MALDATWDFGIETSAVLWAEIDVQSDSRGAVDDFLTRQSDGPSGTFDNLILSASLDYTDAVDEVADIFWYLEASLTGVPDYTPRRRRLD